MPWYVAMIVGALSVFVYEFFKTILKKVNMKPLVRSACAFVLTMVLCVVVAYAIRCTFFTPNWG
jgi:putative flippase GtrA